MSDSAKILPSRSIPERIERIRQKREEIQTSQEAVDPLRRYQSSEGDQPVQGFNQFGGNFSKG